MHAEYRVACLNLTVVRPDLNFLVESQEGAVFEALVELRQQEREEGGHRGRERRREGRRSWRSGGHLEADAAADDTRGNSAGPQYVVSAQWKQTAYLSTKLRLRLRQMLNVHRQNFFAKKNSYTDYSRNFSISRKTTKGSTVAREKFDKLTNICCEASTRIGCEPYRCVTKAYVVFLLIEKFRLQGKLSLTTAKLRLLGTWHDFFFLEKKFWL